MSLSQEGGSSEGQSSESPRAPSDSKALLEAALGSLVDPIVLGVAQTRAGACCLPCSMSGRSRGRPQVWESFPGLSGLP